MPIFVPSSNHPSCSIVHDSSLGQQGRPSRYCSSRSICRSSMSFISPSVAKSLSESSGMVSDAARLFVSNEEIFGEKAENPAAVEAEGLAVVAAAAAAVAVAAEE